MGIRHQDTFWHVLLLKHQLFAAGSVLWKPKLYHFCITTVDEQITVDQLHIVPQCSTQVTHPHLFKSLITVYSMWVFETAVIAASGKEKKDESEDEDGRRMSQ